MRNRPLLAPVLLFGLLLWAGCGDESAAPGGAGPPPLRLEAVGLGRLALADSELEHFRAAGGGYDLPLLLRAHGVSGFHMVRAGGRRIHGSRFKTDQHPYRLFRDGAGFVLVGGYPEERVAFRTLRVEVGNPKRPPATASQPCAFVVGSRSEAVTRAKTEGLPQVPIRGRARVLEFGAVLARLGLENTGRGTWLVVDRDGAEHRIDPANDDGSRPLLKINRRDHVHVLLVPRGKGPGDEGVTEHRFVLRIQWEPADR